jgi:pseudouridine-5'-phosphate glycosidase
MRRNRRGIAPDVTAALDAAGPVVALESTLIVQGLPWPWNLEAARAAEAEVRRAGAVPATIAVLEGVIRVGLEAGELEMMAEAARGTSSRRFLKASRRDLGMAVAQGRDAATTVSATLWIARAQGIGVLATGGLGGVHREASASFDVSTDLDELARGDGMLVVCAGFKSILDMPATLEALETRGVPVVGYRTDTLPAFTTRSSGLPLEVRADTPAEAAALVRAHRALGLPGAIVLAQPVAAAEALDGAVMEEALAAALAAAHARGIRGKAVTPYLLDQIRTATADRSLHANLALIAANARLAAEVAVALGGASEEGGGRTDP